MHPILEFLAHPGPVAPLIAVLHQAAFGAIAAAGFAILFNSPPRLLGYSLAAGALALTVRTLALDAALSLPTASFLAALALALASRLLTHLPSLDAFLLTVTGCIPMVPGSLAANGLKHLFALLQTTGPGDQTASTITAIQSLTIMAMTLAALGTALALPSLIFPRKTQS